MSLVGSGIFNGRFFVAATVFLLGVAQIGSAQLVRAARPVLGYARDADGALPGYRPTIGSSGTRAVEGLLPLQFPDAPLAQTSLTPTPSLPPGMEKIFQSLPEETDDDVVGNASDAVDGVDLRAAFTVLHHGLLLRSQRTQNQPPADPSDDHLQAEEGYHWSGLVAQSLFFNVIENSFRAASDDQIRSLLATKPFWHDYVASMRQFNMRRWNDGDDFLVNYVGHPMQGAVSGFIEIQNDPTGREEEMSATKAYWMSRFKAFLWATAYSTHSEISPLGEAGIGNEGGWTYPIHCPTHCTEPGTYKKYTNNTGWVDFIVTPTGGSLWMLAEDALDRFISDRVQGGNRSRILPKILRGGLNPSRTMANALRFKAPWYRDFQHSPELESSYGVHVLPSDESMRMSQDFRRFALMPYFIAMPLGTAAHPCTVCIQNPGVGLQADIALTRWLAVSFAASKQQDVIAKGSTTNGSTVSAGLGIRLIHDRPNNTLSLAVRPGAVTEHVLVSPGVDTMQNIYPKQLESDVTHAATTIMVSNDYKVSSFFAVRSSFGATIVRYRNPVQTPAGIGKPPYLSWLSHDSYTNKPTWTCEMGPVFHF
jgi:hypothetical protein